MVNNKNYRKPQNQRTQFILVGIHLNTLWLILLEMVYKILELNFKLQIDLKFQTFAVATPFITTYLFIYIF